MGLKMSSDFGTVLGEYCGDCGFFQCEPLGSNISSSNSLKGWTVMYKAIHVNMAQCRQEEKLA